MEVKLIIPDETKVISIVIMYDEGRQYAIKNKLVDIMQLSKQQVIEIKED